MRRFRSAKGAVSVYLIIIIVPIFLFTTVFIDFARVKASELETEQALRAGIRSVMSAYHPELQQWGLFGLGKDSEEAKEIFNQVLIENLKTATGTDIFNYLDTELVTDSAKLTPMYMLSNHTVFERQVLEEMKYRAPIEFALEITDKLQQPATTAIFQSGTKFSSNASSLEKLIDKREDALDDAWSRSEDFKVQIEESYNSMNEKMNHLKDLISKIGSETEASLLIQLASLQSELNSLKSGDKDESEEAQKDRKEEKARLEQEIARVKQILDWIAEYYRIVAQMKVEAEMRYRLLLSIQKDVDDYIQKAKKYNDEIVVELERLREESGSSDLPEVNDVFNHVKIRDQAYLSGFQSGLASVTSLFAGFRNQISAVEMHLNANFDPLIEANDAYLSQNQSFYSQQSVLETQRQQENDNIKGQKKERRNAIKSILAQAKKTLMSSCTVGNEEANKNVYTKLEGDGKNKQTGLYNKYLALNQIDAAGDLATSYDFDDADRSTSSAMGLLDALTDMLISARDKLYLNEYALTKYNYRTLGLEQKPNGEIKQERTLNDPSGHTLYNQEAEYLIYGFSSCEANLTSAYGEMFAIRFAIRTIEELMDPKNEMLNIGSPLLVLLVAAAEGAVKAYSDMDDLIKGKAVPISSKIKSSLLSFTYKDYLRLFLFIHSNDKKLMSRMQSLIELNTGIDLANVSTYMEGSATTSTSLWFTSGLLKILQLTGSSQCTVSGNRCEMTKSFAITY
ncbi:hypothetical protein E0485_01665 [Paenibacillus albiflavus]|uniref:Uncharacterized protein n=1 Tax=Paenibacillus albiflavus TaxID=2545760 RepID=A0A4R4ER63_9BACL|nr:hypothetical protein [Paenibacillus albiflavus]TCZ81015.1 hypothetical protein E0485_01665 [Paenibacillus albiflavus]